MKNFTSIHDVNNPHQLIKDVLASKTDTNFSEIGKGKTLGMIFFNASLRTRLSTQKAAQNLGMQVLVVNVTADSWAIEFTDGAIMNGNTVEHIKEAAGVLSVYCDVISVRCFPDLKNKTDDYSEKILNQFIRYTTKPIISLESAARHPLQSLADLVTIKEHQKSNNPKIVLTWAPHVKAIPQVVANSFAEWVLGAGYNLTISNPIGYNLRETFTKGATIEHNQQKALKDADFVYVKNWCSFDDYGQMPTVAENWMLDSQKLLVTNHAKIMHCLPVRRNVEVSDAVLDSENCLVMQQAENRLHAVQTVLKQILATNF